MHVRPLFAPDGAAPQNSPLALRNLLEFLVAEGHLETSIIGDLDGSGHVGLADLLVLLARWGSADPLADLDQDGLVGFGDLLLLLANWG